MEFQSLCACTVASHSCAPSDTAATTSGTTGPPPLLPPRGLQGAIMRSSSYHPRELQFLGTTTETRGVNRLDYRQNGLGRLRHQGKAPRGVRDAGSPGNLRAGLHTSIVPKPVRKMKALDNQDSGAGPLKAGASKKTATCLTSARVGSRTVRSCRDERFLPPRYPRSSAGKPSAPALDAQDGVDERSRRRLVAGTSTTTA